MVSIREKDAMNNAFMAGMSSMVDLGDNRVGFGDHPAGLPV